VTYIDLAVNRMLAVDPGVASALRPTSSGEAGISPNCNSSGPSPPKTHGLRIGAWQWAWT